MIEDDFVKVGENSFMDHHNKQNGRIISGQSVFKSIKENLSDKSDESDEEQDKIKDIVYDAKTLIDPESPFEEFFSAKDSNQSTTNRKSEESDESLIKSN